MTFISISKFWTYPVLSDHGRMGREGEGVAPAKKTTFFCVFCAGLEKIQQDMCIIFLSLYKKAKITELGFASIPWISRLKGRYYAPIGTPYITTYINIWTRSLIMHEKGTFRGCLNQMATKTFWAGFRYEKMCIRFQNIGYESRNWMYCNILIFFLLIWPLKSI